MGDQPQDGRLISSKVMDRHERPGTFDRVHMSPHSHVEEDGITVMSVKELSSYKHVREIGSLALIFPPANRRGNCGKYRRSFESMDA